MFIIQNISLIQIQLFVKQKNNLFFYTTNFIEIKLNFKTLHLLRVDFTHYLANEF